MTVRDEPESAPRLGSRRRDQRQIRTTGHGQVNRRLLDVVRACSLQLRDVRLGRHQLAGEVGVVGFVVAGPAGFAGLSDANTGQCLITELGDAHATRW